MAICEPYNGEDLQWHPVTPAMSKPSFQGPECCKPLKRQSITTFFQPKAALGKLLTPCNKIVQASQHEATYQPIHGSTCGLSDVCLCAGGPVNEETPCSTNHHIACYVLDLQFSQAVIIDKAALTCQEGKVICRPGSWRAPHHGLHSDDAACDAEGGITREAVKEEQSSHPGPHQVKVHPDVA